MILGRVRSHFTNLAMSIVLYHARVDERMLEALLANPDLFWELPEHAAPAGAQLVFTDKDWAALSWLLSAKAREEQKHGVVVFALSSSRTGGKDLADPDAWKAAKAEEASKRGPPASKNWPIIWL